MSRTQNRQVLAEIGRRAITTSDLASEGGLTQEQVTEFIMAFQDAEPMSSMITWRATKAKSGALPRLGFGSRLLRGKSEMVGPSTMADPTLSSVPFALKSVRLDWEIPNDVLKFAVSEEQYAVDNFNGMSNSFGLDTLDLGLNGDTATDPSDPDYNFLKLLNGWLKKLKTDGGNIVDATAVPGGPAIGKALFFAAKKALPAKWKTRQDRMKWFMHPDMITAYMEELSNGVGTAADQALLDGRTTKIIGNEYVACSKIPTDMILFADPTQMALVYFDNMRLVTTDKGKECVAEDKSYSALFGDYDPIWYWADSAVLVEDVTGV